MIALIRGDEVYKESDWTTWTRNNLSREVEINGWMLVDDYVEVVETDETVTTEPVEPTTPKYTRAELIAMLAELENS